MGSPGDWIKASDWGTAPGVMSLCIVSGLQRAMRFHYSNTHRSAITYTPIPQRGWTRRQTSLSISIAFFINKKIGGAN